MPRQLKIQLASVEITYHDGLRAHLVDPAQGQSAGRQRVVPIVPDEASARLGWRACFGSWASTPLP